MGVYFKDMKMPTGCGNCPCSIYGACDAAEKKPLDEKIRWSGTERMPWCPAIEINQHGRLIDADALLREHKSAFVDKDGYEEFSYIAVTEALTIIPAEGGEKA